jgi:F-type H+-transporting ATPase subunit epsilon
MMHVRIAKVGESLFEGEASSLNIPGSEGEMTILPHHAPLIATLRGGTIRVTDATGNIKSFEIEKGLVEISNNEVIVLV